MQIRLQPIQKRVSIALEMQNRRTWAAREKEAINKSCQRQQSWQKHHNGRSSSLPVTWPETHKIPRNATKDQRESQQYSPKAQDRECSLGICIAPRGMASRQNLSRPEPAEWRNIKTNDSRKEYQLPWVRRYHRPKE